MPPLERVFAMVRLRLSIPCEAKPVEDQKDASGCFRSPHFRPFACMPYNVLDSKEKYLENVSARQCYFIRPRTMVSFNLMRALMSLD